MLIGSGGLAWCTVSLAWINVSLVRATDRCLTCAWTAAASVCFIWTTSSYHAHAGTAAADELARTAHSLVYEQSAAALFGKSLRLASSVLLRLLLLRRIRISRLFFLNAGSLGVWRIHLCHIHGEGEDTSTILALRSYPQQTPVRLDKGLGNSQAEPDALVVHFRRPVQLSKLLCDLGYLLGSEARTRIDHLNC